MPDKSPRAVITLRAPVELRDRLVAHAARSGVSLNAAALILLADALGRAEREAGAR